MIATCLIQYDIIGVTISKFKNSLETNNYFVIYKEKDQSSEETELRIITYDTSKTKYLLIKLKDYGSNVNSYRDIILNNLEGKENEYTKGTQLEILKKFDTLLEAYSYAEKMTNELSNVLLNFEGLYTMKTIKDSFEEAEWQQL